MPATIIDGRAVAARVRQDVAQKVSNLREAGQAAPGLATILVGADPASAVFPCERYALAACTFVLT